MKVDNQIVVDSKAFAIRIIKLYNYVPFPFLYYN